MKKKQVEEIKEKICGICQLAITKKDNYCRLTEYREEKETSTMFYHVECFRTRFMNLKNIQDRANRIFGMAEPIIQRMREDRA